VTKALKQIDGVHEVHISEDRRHAVVTVDGTVSPEALEAAVRQLGYGTDVAGR
jgi:copper chaperone CopZ